MDATTAVQDDRGPWRVERDGRAVYRDDAEHAALVARTLRIDVPTWRAVVREYGERWSPGGDAAARLAVLRDAWATVVPAAAVPTMPAPRSCPACLGGVVVPRVARDVAGDDARGDVAVRAPRLMVYGRCAACGHGVLLSEPAPMSVYRDPRYYRAQGVDGVGYAAYAAEQGYREERGRRLLEWVVAHRPAPRSYLEVGSGFGYTRRAAETLGMATMGVDLNPHAARSAAELYGHDTFVGSLGEALAAGAVAPRAWDVVLYNFVLEHVPDPQAELRLAARALGPGGVLVLVVPSMDSPEVEVFGGAYRSFRTDHLHLFSRESLARMLARAGLRVAALKTECSAHLFRGFLDDEELDALYQRGEGPDMIVLATHATP